MKRYGLLAGSILLLCAGCASAPEKTVSVEFVQEQVAEGETQEKKETMGESSVSNAEKDTTNASKEQPFWVVSESSAGNPVDMKGEESSVETEQETLEESQSVEPVYFEGTVNEIRDQKHAMLIGNPYHFASMNYIESKGNTGVDLGYEFFQETDERYYSAEEFSDCPDIVLKLAKNEIYARHGRMFYDRELYEFFLSRTWYYPEYTPEEFDESCLNEYEMANIELLVSLGA